MFCGCTANSTQMEPNTAVCPVCLGMPGVLPVVNQAAVEKVVMTGLALGCEIPKHNRFDRKNYMYPDLPKGYQISQYELPMAVEGSLEFDLDGERCQVGITRVHLEEDTARLVHRTDSGASYSLVDINRAGVPLMEIVSEPDLRTPAQARQYLVTVRQILRYIGASSGNMEEGAFRCDANISQRAVDGSFAGPKVEIKNLNSFRSVERALDYEIHRQREAIQSGVELVQETRGWLEDEGRTVTQRGKEYAEDYRYFPEPDLPPVEFDDSWINRIQDAMAELPAQRRERFVAEYPIDEADARILTEEPAIADYYEKVVKASGGLARPAANWITGEVFALARVRGGFDQIELPVDDLASIIVMVDRGEINTNTGKAVLLKTVETDLSPAEIVSESGLAQQSDADELRAIVRAVMDAHPQPVADYRGGKQAAIGFLIGQVMQQTRGTANPDIVRQELLAELNSVG